jgi:outer membrane protein assembly factor BamC
MLIVCRVDSAVYSGHPALRPSGQLRCSKSLRAILSSVFALSRLRSPNFEVDSVIRTAVVIVLLFITACNYIPGLDEVIPDRRTEYRKSEPLPDLEVPPDLTTDALNEPMVIPDEEATTLTEFERQRALRRGGMAAGNLAGVDALPDEQWLSVQASVADIWPKLREFWQGRGYTLDLDDAELGVIETGWKESDTEGIAVFRDKFRIFAESGAAPGNTVILISSERQERILGEEGSADWVGIEKNTALEKQIVGELNVFFYGTAAPVGISSATAAASPSANAYSVARGRAEVLNLGEDKVYLSLPEEFTRAWKLTEDALQRAGLFIENQDRSKGLYYVLYYEPEEDEEGLLSKLAFWKDDEPEGKVYQISLTGVGDKTELVVLNEKGDWAENREATRILTLLQAQYNTSR